MNAVLYDLPNEIEGVECSDMGSTLVVIDGALSDTDKDTLSKIFKAVGSNMAEDVSIIEVLSKEGHFDINAMLYKGFIKIIYFGFALDRVPFQSRKTYNYPLRFEGFSLLIAQDIELIRTDKNEKMKFWTALKALYGI